MLAVEHKVANVTLTSGKWTGSEHCETAADPHVSVNNVRTINANQEIEID